jgi:PAP2 superfamily
LKNIFLKILTLAIGFCSSYLAQAQKKVPDFSHGVATQWFDLQLTLIPETPGFTPPVVSRALGYTTLTLYESLVNGMPHYRTMAGIVQELDPLPLPEKNKSYHWEVVANAAQAVICQALYATHHIANQAKIQSLKTKINAELQNQTDEATFKRSIKYGEDIANALFKYSKSDGADQAEIKNFDKNFKSLPGACMWLPQANQKALQPYWGNNRTFISGTADFDLPVPPKCEIGNTSLMYAQALEVYSVGKNLSKEQKDIALFWSDDPVKTFTPPGHGISIATQLIKKENLSLEKTAELYCRLGIAVNDAFVSCWKCKYTHNLLRPISFIQTAIDPTWKPFLDTPPFPEYTSGHGTVSGAIAIVLSDIFGYNYSFTDYSHKQRGLKPRTYDSFLEFAQEAALSRLYGGIHYRMSNDEGLKNGKRIGKKICALKMKDS